MRISEVAQIMAPILAAVINSKEERTLAVQDVENGVETSEELALTSIAAMYTSLLIEEAAIIAKKEAWTQ